MSWRGHILRFPVEIMGIDMIAQQADFVFSDLEINHGEEISQRVAYHWYAFSTFIPNFLEELSRNISNRTIRLRILEIVSEEMGGGFFQTHAEMFYQAMTYLGHNISLIEVEAIRDFEDEFKQKIMFYDPEAFSVGVSFGLEVIAEENIQFLLSSTSRSKAEYEANKSSTFFKIHLINEKDHIEKCKQNLALIDSSKSESLMRGINLSLRFWRNFWKLAVHDS